MDREALKRRTKAFALQVVRFVGSMPGNAVARTLGHQLLRSGTSVGANYRAACRARSRADFISKIGVVEEEADETLYWLEVISESGVVKPDGTSALIAEAQELVAIFTAAGRTTKARSQIRNPKFEIRN
ncbi:MAG: four helix bundle protein [candidate division NC10 bacterium]|nr:four helix bundle protein [candidate division NC10 bacterium]MBI2457395.1 four helix bundle protein [candidate division NC10 bacterium]MBI3087197.1 four helix bundle protein [candidate division NC10 bacterium]